MLVLIWDLIIFSFILNNTLKAYRTVNLQSCIALLLKSIAVKNISEVPIWVNDKACWTPINNLNVLTTEDSKKSRTTRLNVLIIIYKLYIKNNRWLK